MRLERDLEPGRLIVPERVWIGDRGSVSDEGVAVVILWILERREV